MQLDYIELHFAQGKLKCTLNSWSSSYMVSEIEVMLRVFRNLTCQLGGERKKTLRIRSVV